MDSKTYTISGKVVHGDGYGRKLGYPTINIDYRETDIPQIGVYAGSVDLEGKIYKAGIVVSEAINKKIPKIEAHVIGYNGDAYDQEVVLTVEKFIREYKNFNSEEELINQIKEDLKKC